MRILMLSVLFLISLHAIGQTTTTQVNPDGSHTTIHNNGNTSTIVNPNGTHTTQYHNGQTTTQINPDGSHTIQHHNGQTTTQINPDGTHTIIQNSGETQVFKQQHQEEEANISSTEINQTQSETTQEISIWISRLMSLAGVIASLIIALFILN